LLNEVYEKNGSLHKIYQLCAELKRREGDLAGAARFLQEGIGKFPHHADLHAQSAFLSYERGKMEDGERSLRLAISFAAGNIRAYYLFALEWQKGEWEQVERRFAAFPGPMRKNREALLIMSTTHMQREKYDMALECLEGASLQCQDRYVTAGIFYLEGLIHWQKGDCAAAALALRQAALCSTGLGNALLAEPLGLILEGRFNDAAGMIRSAVKKLYPFPEAYFLLGFCEEEEGNRARARKFYKGALRFSPHDRRYREALRRVR
jgi:tetratricopeptide (TPR) repeat protein